MLIFLLGIMCSGKTTTGRKLARELNYSFFDIDENIEKEQGKSIGEIIEKKGDDFFRKIERRKLKETFKKKNTVVSTGGGTPCYFDNIDLMNKKGITVFMNPGEEIIFNRWKLLKDSRPLLKKIPTVELQPTLHRLLTFRAESYGAAKIMVNGKEANNEHFIAYVIRRLYHDKPGLSKPRPRSKNYLQPLAAT